MTTTLWFIIFGAVFTLMGLSASVVRRLPLTASLLYLALGVALGPHVLGFFRLDPLKDAGILERVTEIIVIVSLFAAGLKLRIAWDDAMWKLALRLAIVSMILTVGLIAFVGVAFLKLPLGAAVLLGGILAPTDPVLASDVQVKSPHDRDRLRFSLTGEAGFNDGTAFPFVMLGLGLLGLHDIGEFGAKWFLVDVLWAVSGGLLIGAGLGIGVSHLVMWRRRRHKETVILDDFMALGLIALSYGISLLAHSYGFLAVFAAGLAMRRSERRMTGEKAPAQVKELAALGSQDEVIASSPEKVPAYTAQAILFFNEQLERLGEAGMVILLGGMVVLTPSALQDAWFLPVLFLLIRPVSVAIGLWGSAIPATQTRLIAWFGIRGIGSLYYLMYAVERGLAPELAARLTSLVLITVGASVLLHGLSVTPLMNRHSRKLKQAQLSDRSAA